MTKEYSPLSPEIYNFRQKALLDNHPTKPVTWIENARTHRGITKSLVIILPTRGCSWARSESGGCTICGYINDSAHCTTPDIWQDFKVSIDKYNESDYETIKLFNSGSFFDFNEISEQIQTKILETLSQKTHIKEIFVESRPEFILANDKAISTYKELLPNTTLTVGIGLETSNDFIRKNYINKGFSWNDYQKAVFSLYSHKIFTKAYLLFKPPFLTEFEAIQDIIASVKAISTTPTSFISINPVTIHAKTYVEYLWNNGLYRPPWLHSLIHTICELQKLKIGIPVLCDLVNAGKQRGPHNCGKCDKQLSLLIQEYSLQQSLTVDNLPECECKTFWQRILTNERYFTISQQWDYYRGTFPRRNLNFTTY